MNVKGDSAVVFVYGLGQTPAAPLKLRGLNPNATYRIEEIDLAQGQTGIQTEMKGEELMQSGLSLPAYGLYQSAVIRLTVRANN